MQSSLGALGSYKGGLLNALVWGDKAGLGWGTYEDFKKIGMLHILVASGANVIFLVEIVVWLLAWLVGRKKAICLGLVVGWLYSLSVGFGAPVIRGVLFASLRYGSILLGRGFSWTRNLLFLLMILLVADTDLFFSDSLWLSVAAFVGIATFTEIRVLENSSKVLKEFIKGLWIGIWVLPLVAIKFGSISLLSPLVSATIFWLLEPLIFVGASAGIFYMFNQQLGVIVYLLAEKMLDCLIWIVAVYNNFPIGVMEVGVNTVSVSIWYGFCLLVFSKLKKQ